MAAVGEGATKDSDLLRAEFLCKMLLHDPLNIVYSWFSPGDFSEWFTKYANGLRPHEAVLHARGRPSKLRNSFKRKLKATRAISGLLRTVSNPRDCHNSGSRSKPKRFHREYPFLCSPRVAATARLSFLGMSCAISWKFELSTVNAHIFRWLRLEFHRWRYQCLEALTLVILESHWNYWHWEYIFMEREHVNCNWYNVIE